MFVLFLYYKFLSANMSFFSNLFIRACDDGIFFHNNIVYIFKSKSFISIFFSYF